MSNDEQQYPPPTQNPVVYPDTGQFPPGYPPPGYPPPGYSPPGYPPPGYPPTVYPPPSQYPPIGFYPPPVQALSPQELQQQQAVAMERTNLKRDIRSVCLTVTAFVASITILSSFIMVIIIFIQVLTNDMFMQILLQSDDAFNTLMSNRPFQLMMSATMQDWIGVVSCLSIILGSLWFFLMRGKRFVTTDVTKKTAKAQPLMLLQIFVLIGGVQLVMILINMMLQTILAQSDVSMTDTLESSTSSILATPAGWIYIILIAPVVEETVFRGAVMRKLERYGANFAIITSSLLFGLYHVILFQAIFAFAVGLLFAYVAGRYSLKWAMLLHGLNNLIACLSALSATASTAILIFYIACLIASIVLLIARRGVFRTQKQAGAPAFPGVFKVAYSSPWLIAFMAVFVVYGFLIL